MSCNLTPFLMDCRTHLDQLQTTQFCEVGEVWQTIQLNVVCFTPSDGRDTTSPQCHCC